MNFKEFLNETDTTDMPSDPVAYQDLLFKPLFDLDVSHLSDEEIDGELDEDPTLEEICGIVDSAEPDLLNIIIDILTNNYGVILKKREELIGVLIDTWYMGDREVFAQYCHDIISIVDDYYHYQEDFEQYGDTAVAETAVDIAHTKQLRRDRKRSSWKRDAILRARYRKTGQGKRENKKILKYLKKYRKQNKAKLKMYSKKYQNIWKGNTSN